GNLITAGRKSALSLYRPDIATMESGESIYNQDDATGFIKLNALRLRVKAMVEKQAKKNKSQ
ncbi:MAG: argininosuccinate synthase, partial [Verrucomicrobia bacterium]|nr:argininosuccinate synthase [Verrucomicrobiota bacterium]